MSRSNSPRPQLPWNQAKDAIGRRLTTRVPASSGGIGFWLTVGADIDEPGESAGAVAARASSYRTIAWNSPDERDHARVAKAQSLVGHRVSMLSEAFGGYQSRWPEQIAREGDRITYRLAIVVRLHDEHGPLPWLGPVTETQTRGPDNSTAPSFARLLRAELTVDLAQIPDPVAAMSLSRERRLEVFGVWSGHGDRPDDGMTAVLSDSIARGEGHVPFPFVDVADLSWGVVVPWTPDSIYPSPPEVDVLADAHDIELAARITRANLGLIQAHRAGPDAYQQARRSAEPWTREVIALGDEVTDLVRARLALPVHVPTDPTSQQRHPETFDSPERSALWKITGRATTLRHFVLDPSTDADADQRAAAVAELADLRTLAARNPLVRKGAGQWLAEVHLAHIAADLGAQVQAKPTGYNGTRYTYDVEIEVVFEDATGSRIMWAPSESRPPEEPCSRILVLRGLCVDLAGLTADQICAADVQNTTSLFEKDHRRAVEKTLTSLITPGVRPDLFVSAEALDWDGYREHRPGRVPRLLRVLADNDQIQRALAAARGIDLDGLGAAITEHPTIGQDNRGIDADGAPRATDEIVNATKPGIGLA